MVQFSADTLVMAHSSDSKVISYPLSDLAVVELSNRTRTSAQYQNQAGVLDLRGRMITGNIGSRNALRLIEHWASVHRLELELNWIRMRAGRPFERIAPLE